MLIEIDFFGILCKNLQFQLNFNIFQGFLADLTGKSRWALENLQVDRNSEQTPVLGPPVGLRVVLMGGVFPSRKHPETMCFLFRFLEFVRLKLGPWSNKFIWKKIRPWMFSWESGGFQHRPEAFFECQGHLKHLMPRLLRPAELQTMWFAGPATFTRF